MPCLPLDQGSVDLVFSVLCCNGVAVCPSARRIRRVSPRRVFLFSTLGEFFAGMRSSWQEVDNSVHVRQFLRIVIWAML
ncbi:MAG: hypothetical protein ACYYK0_01025 [Candidatus Eutrophobiaceae bacterium]